MKRIFALILFFVFLIASKSLFAGLSLVHYPNRSAISLASIDDTTCRIIPARERTYGYEILIDGKAVIRQITIPGRRGANGFRTKSDAEKVARLVVLKIRSGLVPPVIQQYELDSLRIPNTSTEIPNSSTD